MIPVSIRLKRRKDREAGTISVADAITQALIKAKANRRPSYVADLEKRWRRFERWLAPQKRSALNAIMPSDIRAFLNHCDLAPEGEHNMLRNLSVLFSWARKQHKIAANPCSGMANYESEEKPPARILTIEELKALFRLAENGFPIQAPAKDDPKARRRWERRYGSISFLAPPFELIPWLGLGCFAGLRPEESERLIWEEIDFERGHIDLPASKSKTRERRLIPMCDILVAWLSRCQQKEGAVKPRNFVRKRRALTEAMGWDRWPKDVLRHSFGSYHLAKFKNAALTAEIMGHKNARMLYKHYRDVIKNDADVEAYWLAVPAEISNA